MGDRSGSETAPGVRPVERGGTIATLGDALRRFETGAPAHAIFVHFTIALTAASAAFDALGRLLGAESLADAGWWTLAGAALATPLPLAAAGLVAAALYAAARVFGGRSGGAS